ncbi:hypothetical protein GCM10010245_92240 [Streptomyces spectabilis]|nr:hypothetical protein GCM10010245_92240 [Streptomyces spectabilis]
MLAHNKGTDSETAITREYIDRFTRQYHDIALSLSPPARSHLEGVACWAQGRFDWLDDSGRYTA